MLLIDKPTDYTSHDIVALVRKYTRIKKVGHAGTLDPAATGLLIVLVGRAETKLQDQYMAEEKEYVAEVTLGQVSTTYDQEGDIIESGDATTIKRSDIENVLKQFIGEIEQRPPIHSAIHIKGQRSYKLARQGKIKPEDMPPRQVTIYSIELLSVDLSTFSIRINCGKGTYIRSLANDIGSVLGVGGYMSALRRTKIGEHSVEDAMTVDEFPSLSERVNADGTGLLE